MAQQQPIVRIDLDPRQPVQEVCAVIAALLPYHPADKEDAILQRIADAIAERQAERRAAHDDKSVR